MCSPSDWRATTILCLAAASCSLDWDRFDPRMDAGDRGDAVMLVVEPVYPANARWNDYVRNAEPAAGPYHQEDRACDGSVTGGYDLCIHAGERRKVAVEGHGSCEGLTIDDALDAFDWECLVEEETATFFTRGLRPDRGLSDLVEAVAWRSNHVTVHLEGDTIGESAPAAWWSSPVRALPAGTGPVTLDEPGTIYTVATSRATDGHLIGADRVAVVTLGNATLSWAGASGDALLAAQNVDFAWIEAQLDGGGEPAPSLRLQDVAFTHIRHGVIQRGGLAGLQLGPGARDSYVLDLSISGVDGDGVLLSRSSYNTLEQVVSHDNTGSGLVCMAAEDPRSLRNVFLGIVAHDNATHGFVAAVGCSAPRVRDLVVYGNAFHGLSTNGSDASVVGVAAADNGLRGVNVDGAARVIVARAIVFNNGEHGLMHSSPHATDSVFTGITSLANGGPIGLWRGSGTTVSHLTILNGGGHGVQTLEAVDSTIVQVLAVNSILSGIRLGAASSGNLLAHVASSDNGGAGISIGSGSTGNRFTDLLLVGPPGAEHCSVEAGGDGLDDSCNNTSGSDADPVMLGMDASGSFVGRVLSDDVSNTMDSSGAGPYGRLDWASFDNPFRGWGRESTSPFPGPTHAGRCNTGSCRIWDLRLRTTDALFLNRSGDGRTPNDPFVAGSPCPVAVHGDRALTDRQATPNTFLVNATEIFDDEPGDEDGLCESDEACIYSPNIGAYQGEGAFRAAGTCEFQDGMVSGVELYAYPVNGG